MQIENQIRAIAGTFILTSLVLHHFQVLFDGDKWLYFTAFVGVNLLQSAFTHFCPLEILLRKIQKKTKETI